MLHHRAVRPLFLVLLGVACATNSPKASVGPDCPTAVAAERELAAKEGRPPVPLIQRGGFMVDLSDERYRPRITIAMAKEVKSATLKMLARISVKADGTVQSVEVVESSGSRSFDEEVATKMKTWTHRPSLIDCRPVPYVYPMHWEHKFTH
jgi:TonB family protein